MEERKNIELADCIMYKTVYLKEEEFFGTGYPFCVIQNCL